MTPVYVRTARHYHLGWRREGALLIDAACGDTSPREEARIADVELAKVAELCWRCFNQIDPDAALANPPDIGGEA